MVSRGEMVDARPDLADSLDAAHALFPVKVTRSFWNRMNPADPADPLARQVLHSPEELVVHPEDEADPVGDAAKSPVPWVVHKYADRVLLMMTKRCHLYCRYCFRRNHEPGGLDPTAEEWEAALAYIESARPREVILSGGDPLAVRDDRLFATLDRLAAVSRVLRIHSRAPITFPERITDAFVAELRARQPLYLVVHTNHANELSAEVDQGLARLVDAGIPVLNQAVLLRGVNDDADVLASLFEALLERRVKPYYLHHTDHAAGNAHFRVSLDEGRVLMRQVRERVGGLALPVYVLDPPDGSGKRPIAY
ncbi:MAG: KamA family radical SAM protein [Deltaproteobacteria bacterium]|nr:MAG: KamA family radical SAM protein [Deltaproteobacteria bacterium]